MNKENKHIESQRQELIKILTTIAPEVEIIYEPDKSEKNLNYRVSIKGTEKFIYVELQEELLLSQVSTGDMEEHRKALRKLIKKGFDIKYDSNYVGGFQGFLNTLACKHCKFLDKNSDIPMDERRCTNSIALLPNERHPDGVEDDKDYFRKEIEETLAEGKTPIYKSVNDFFTCKYYEEQEVEFI